MAPGFDKFEAFCTEIEAGQREPHRYGCGSGRRQRHSRDSRQQLGTKGGGGNLRGRSSTIHIVQPGRTFECTGKGKTKRHSRIAEAAPPLWPHFVQAATGDGKARHGPNATCQMPHFSVHRVYVRQSDQTEVAHQNQTGRRRSGKSFATWPSRIGQPNGLLNARPHRADDGIPDKQALRPVFEAWLCLLAKDGIGRGNTQGQNFLQDACAVAWSPGGSLPRGQQHIQSARVGRCLQAGRVRLDVCREGRSPPKRYSRASHPRAAGPSPHHADPRQPPMAQVRRRAPPLATCRPNGSSRLERDSRPAGRATLQSTPALWQHQGSSQLEALEVMLALMERFKRLWILEDGDSKKQEKEVLFPALFVIAAYAGGLRGEEVPLMDLF